MANGLLDLKEDGATTLPHWSRYQLPVPRFVQAMGNNWQAFKPFGQICGP